MSQAHGKKKLNKLVKTLYEQPYFIVCAALLILMLSAALAPPFLNSMANIVWEKHQNPDITLALNYNDASLAKKIGDYYFNGGSYEPRLAEKAYTKALAIDPKVPYGNYQLARVYFVEGRYDLAIEAINRELEANSENFRTYYVRGLVYGYRGNLDKAEADFREFIKWAPREWAGYNDLAWILNRQTKYEEVKGIIETAFAKVPSGAENPWLWNSLGVAELNLEEYKAAEQSFLKAEKLAENLTHADWQTAYPGNDAATADEGLRTFRDAIQKNLETAQICRKAACSM